MPGPIPANTPTPEPTDIPTNVATPTPSDTPTNTPTPMPAATPTHTPTPTPETRKPKPPPTPDFSGKLAIPVMLGFQSKVYVTEFNGAGINGPRPVSLDARQPMFSQDGKSLIVKGTTGGLSGVFVTDDRGRVLEILIDRDSAYWPVLSPDGGEVMFAEMTLDYKLLRRKSNGVISEVQANNRPILAYNALWSDDNRLVFQGCATWLEQPGECGTWVTDANNIAPVRIIVGNHGRPMDAKSGLLAYMSDEDGDWDIYLVSLGGGEPQNITLNRSQDGLAAIAPDGKSVAYISNESGIWALWTVTLSNREKQRWFDIDPQRGTIDVNNWAGERLSWTR
jgi:Tol biopolymer transport system component